MTLMYPIDYAERLDPEVLAFIARTESFYPPGTETLTLSEQRKNYDKLCAAFSGERPAGVTVHDAPLGGVPCRHYTPEGAKPHAMIVYFHGGGFVVGGLESHDSICAEIAAATGAKLIAVDYRLAPEHLHPAERDDTLAVLKALRDQTDARLVLVGDSAGGMLAALACGARIIPGIAGQVLIYPMLGGDYNRGSTLIHANAPALTRDEVLYYDQVRFAPGTHRTATTDPLRATDFSGLPPTVVFVADCDPIADDGRAYVERISQAGGSAQIFNEVGLIHGYLRARHMSARAALSFAHICAAITALTDC